MRTAPITDLKNRLSHYLRLVAKGETVTVLDRGRPVARMTRIESSDEELESLVAAGIARAPEAPLPRGFLERKLPQAGKSVLDALSEDREDRA